MPHFHSKILLCFLHADEASRANLHADKRIIYWPPFWNKVYYDKYKTLQLFITNEAANHIVILNRISSSFQVFIVFAFCIDKMTSYFTIDKNTY